MPPPHFFANMPPPPQKSFFLLPPGLELGKILYWTESLTTKLLIRNYVKTTVRYWESIMRRFCPNGVEKFPNL